jgi:electron transfer flavoprotein alpha subunit
MSRLLIVAFDAAEASQLGGFAQALALPFDLLLVEGSSGPLIGQEKTLSFGSSQRPNADALAEGLKEMAPAYTRIASVSSMKSKDTLGRLAGLLDAPLVTDVLSVESPDTFVRPMVAGSVLAKVQVAGEPILMTVRPAGFPRVDSQGEAAAEAAGPLGPSSAEVVARSQKSGGRPDLSQAKVVVSGGRPLGDSETFERIIGGLADALGGAVGATRAAVDSGIAPNELQVGQTGKIVAPDLYIAAGISGSTQHMAGIKDSKVIVAINKDPEAPIFQIADFGLVADLFDAVPELQSKAGK